MRHTVGHIASEAEYFRRLDAELIDEMHRRAALEEHHLRMAEACQVNDPEIVDALEKLGFDETTVPLLCLVPLLQVAWIHGSVSHAERDRVFTLASLHGVKEHTPAYQRIVEWLERRPSEEFFQGTLHALRAILASLPPGERKARKSDVVQGCTAVASAGRLFRMAHGAERKLLEEIEKQLERHEQAAAPAGETVR